MAICSRNFLYTLALGGLTSFATSAQEVDSNWFRDAAISPDGGTIAFSYLGDIYLAGVDGGRAVPLTMHVGWEGNPVWSPDGSRIAFASDRHGNLDVFVVSAEGGVPTRLTFHSADDTPSAFTTDGAAVLFSGSHMDTNQNAQFPSGVLPELYAVSLDGGTPRHVLTTPAIGARPDAGGTRLVYYDQKGYENFWRKHHTSSIARDVWLYDAGDGSHTKLTEFPGEDRTPVWAADNPDQVFYLSEQSGTFNVWHMSVSTGMREQITFHDFHPVRSLSISDGGTLAYTYHGNIHTVEPGDEPRAVDIQVLADAKENAVTSVPVNTGISAMTVSPDGKEIAFVVRGEIFVTSTEMGMTKRITNTPEQERMPAFSPDGRKLAYAGERDGSWNIYETTIADDAETHFYAATKLEERALLDSDDEEFQPRYAPDGKSIGYIRERDTVAVLELESGFSSDVLGASYNFSYTDGDLSFDWSPDSRWMSVGYASRDRLLLTNVGIVPVFGGEPPVDISLSGYYDGVPIWSTEGDAILWLTTRYGERSHASFGGEFDVMSAFLTQEAFDRFRLTKDEFALVKELEDANKKRDEDKPEPAPVEEPGDGELAEGDPLATPAAEQEAEEEADDELRIEWANMQERTLRLTGHSSTMPSGGIGGGAKGSFALGKDRTQLYYLSQFEKGFDLWAYNLRDRSSRVVAKLGAQNASFSITEDGKTAVVLADGRLSKVTLGKGQARPQPVKISARMDTDTAAERAYMFEHIQRQVRDKFYRSDLHGVDWDRLGAEIAAKLDGINNDRDFAILMSEMLGELNGSHTGASVRGRPRGDQTAALGAFFDFNATGPGIPLTEIMEKGPLAKAGLDISPGMRIQAIEGEEITDTTNLFALLNHRAGERLRIKVSAADGSNVQEKIITPISGRAENQLRYDRWVAERRELVERLSNGRLGYTHVRSMNDSSFRTVYSDTMGRNFSREALVVDTRFNGGGWIHDDLAQFLSGVPYLQLVPRERDLPGEPINRWTKPSVVVMSESNYSDAYIFPRTYKILNIGELVGTPVPGTGTAVWWETLHTGTIRFGIPQLGTKDMQGRYQENFQIDPDHLVYNDFESVARGRDLQLERSVEVLLAKLSGTSD